MSDDNWHLSKSVPITLIFGLLVQGAAIVWTVSMMMSDIEDNSEELKEYRWPSIVNELITNYKKN